MKPRRLNLGGTTSVRDALVAVGRFFDSIEEDAARKYEVDRLTADPTVDVDELDEIAATTRVAMADARRRILEQTERIVRQFLQDDAGSKPVPPSPPSTH